MTRDGGGVGGATAVVGGAYVRSTATTVLLVCMFRNFCHAVLGQATRYILCGLHGYGYCYY